MTEKRVSEITCPLCKKVFSTKTDEPRTKEQWKISLLVHLIASPRHHMKTEEAEHIADSYLAKL